MANYNVQWVKSQKGKDKLIVDDYMFESNGKGKAAGVTYWTCSYAGCKVNAKTEFNQLVKVNGITNPPDHGHIKDTAQINGLQLTVSICLTI